MMNKKIGQQSIQFANPPIIISTANIGGPKEKEGYQGENFDILMENNINGFDSWEKCESYMTEQVIAKAAEKANKQVSEIEVYLVAGDLLNQLLAEYPFCNAHIATASFLGLYGACSTMAESILISSMMIDGGFANLVAAAASSHHDARREKTVSFSWTELGVQRPPVAQWTVKLGAGSCSNPHCRRWPSSCWCNLLGKLWIWGSKIRIH